jgi:lysozyme
VNSYIIRHLTAEEGIREEPYKDSEGWWTIGVGHLIDRRKGGNLPFWIDSFPILLDEAEKLLKDDIADLEKPLFDRFPWISALSSVRECVFLSMAFQMGVAGLATFKNTLKYAKNGSFHLAAAEMLESDWRDQTPERAGRLAQAMRTNSSQFLEGAA